MIILSIFSPSPSIKLALGLIYSADIGILTFSNFFILKTFEENSPSSSIQNFHFFHHRDCLTPPPPLIRIFTNYRFYDNLLLEFLCFGIGFSRFSIDFSVFLDVLRNEKFNEQVRILRCLLIVKLSKISNNQRFFDY